MSGLIKIEKYQCGHCGVRCANGQILFLHTRKRPHCKRVDARSYSVYQCPECYKIFTNTHQGISHLRKCRRADKAKDKKIKKLEKELAELRARFKNVETDMR